MTDNIFSAVDSALGYYYQGLYALVYFLNSTEDNEEVLIEDLDDVVVKNLATNAFSLKQLKHKKNSTLSISSKDFWSTMRIWSKYTNANNISNLSFHLITCSKIKTDCSLNTFRNSDVNRGGGS